MAWAPKYGLKGMIDASIRVREESNGFKANEEILPLEFKTGKVPNGQASLWSTQKLSRLEKIYQYFICVLNIMLF